MSNQPVCRFPIPELDSLPEEIRERIAEVQVKADISERQRTMLDYALKVCRKAERVDESDYQRLNQHGFDDEDIWDIGAISTFFGLSNRLVNMSSMLTNEEFYLMGRVPKDSAKK